MAENAADNLSIWLEIKKESAEYLTGIRHWKNLKIAADERNFYLKDFTEGQLLSAELKSIPDAVLFQVKENKFFRINSLVPERKAPSSLLWTPVERGLPVTLPSMNHNYFRLNQTVKIRLMDSEEESEPAAMLTSFAMLSAYAEKAPAVRLVNLKWVLTGEGNVFIKGIPILPVHGDTFWKQGNSYYPSGSEPEFDVLSEMVEKKLQRNKTDVIVWNRDSTYHLIPENFFKILTLSSVRQTGKQRNLG
jgi:hypothetical protein